MRRGRDKGKGRAIVKARGEKDAAGWWAGCLGQKGRGRRETAEAAVRHPLEGTSPGAPAARRAYFKVCSQATRSARPWAPMVAARPGGMRDCRISSCFVMLAFLTTGEAPPAMRRVSSVSVSLIA